MPPHDHRARRSPYSQTSGKLSTRIAQFVRNTGFGARIRSTILIGVLLALPAAPAVAQWLRWPASPGSEAGNETRREAQAPNAAVRLRIIQHGGQRELWVDNDLFGPVEVRIESAEPLPGLPLQRQLSGPGRQRLLRLPGNQPLRLKLQAVPGPRNPRIDDIAYPLPLALAQPRIGQAPQGEYSHTDAENREAIDFAAPIGTPVVAARAGRVMQAEGRFGDTPGRLDQANLIRILHDDGSMAVYAHLQHGSLRVRAGQAVHAGQLIAQSGNSGYSSGPHLHFAVQVNAGLQLVSVPLRIVSKQGELRLPATNTQR